MDVQQAKAKALGLIHDALVKNGLPDAQATLVAHDTVANAKMPDALVPPSFDHDVHPRHGGTGQFVDRGDVDQAMRRIDDGRQGSRTTLPKPNVPDHPNT